MCLMYYELPKLSDNINTADELNLWLALFKANTKEELLRIERLGVPVMNEAISAYNTVVVSPEFKELERLRERAGHDEAAALRNASRKAEKENSIKIAKNLLKMNMAVEQVSKATGLTNAEIEKLRVTST